MQRSVRLELIALLALALVVPSAGVAQDVGVRAYLSPGSAVGVGQPFVLNVEVTGTQSLDREPQVPDLGRFSQYLGSNTQSSMRVIDGRTSVSLNVQYRYQAVREGTFEIPSFAVVAGGRTLRTEALPLTVSAEPPGPGQSGSSDASGVAPEDLFITSEASKTRVHEGEPFVVEYRIWTKVDVSSFNFTRVPEPAGFWVEDVTPQGPPRVEQLTRSGQQYASAVIRRVALVPMGAGTRTIDPIVLEAQVRLRGADPFDRFFGGRSFFGGSSVAAGVVSEPLTITVEALPAGAPDPFSGVVGRLEIDTSLDRDSVATNDAVTLTVRMSGDGNLRAVPAPELGLASDFEVFPPEVSESVRALGAGLTGEKTFEYVVIPRAPGSREIPPLTMSYFDPDAGVYRTAESVAIPLTVTGAAAEGPADVARGGVAELRRDIRFIHLGGALRPAAGPLHEGVGFWMFALLPLVGIVGAMALRRHRDLLEGDIAYARGRRAGRVARKRLAAARKLASSEDTRAFYAEVARALRGLVADRLNVAEAGLQTGELDARLEARGVSPATRAELAECLAHCDRQRFAPPGSDSGEKDRILDRAGSLMSSLDRELRR